MKESQLDNEGILEFAAMGEKEAAFGAASFFLFELFRVPDESLLFQFYTENSRECSIGT
jgi:hypothetical protein